MADCMSVFCGARSSTDTLRAQKNQPTERQKDQPANTNCTEEQPPETSPGVKADLSPTGQVSAESLQRNWEQLKEQQLQVEKEMHTQEEIREKQVEKLRQLQMTLDSVHRRQSYQDSPSPRIAQDMETDSGDHHLQQHASLQNLHPQGVNRSPVQQPPDLLPQHRSLPQVHQHLIAPLPAPSDALSQMRQQHFERLQQMQQQIRHQQQHCMQMIPPPLLPLQSPLQSPLQPLLQPALPTCHQMQMKHLQQMQNMQQHLTQLHSMSHDSLLRKTGGLDLMKQCQSQMLVVSNEQEQNHMSQTRGEVRHTEGDVRTESSITEYALKHVATIEEPRNRFRKPGTPMPTFDSPHSNSPHYGCYSNVDLSNPFPVPVDSKQRRYSVYEGFYAPSPEHWPEDSQHLYRTHSSSDIDMPSLEESDFSGSLSDLLAAGTSCSNISTSEATELQFSDSEDENRSHYDSLPHEDVMMDDEVCVSDDAVGKGAYVRRNSCPNVFNDHTCDRHSFNSDFSGSSDYSEDNTSEITDTFSHSLESSCTEEASDLNPESDVPDIDQVITPAERHQKYIDHDEKIDHVAQVIELSKAGSWSELSKSAITALLEEIDDSDRSSDEEDENSIGSILDSYQDEVNMPNGDIILNVDVIGETAYDGDTDTLERRPINIVKDENTGIPYQYSNNNGMSNDVEDDDDATLTGDSSSDCDSDVMKTVIRRDNRKDIGGDPGAEAIYSPVIKRRGVCEAEIASSQTSLSSVSHPKMATVLQQQQPFKAKTTTWAMSCLRPCPPIRPSNLARDDATKSPRIGRKSSVTRRKPVEDVKTLEDDAHLLKVIEAYCTSAKTRQTVNSLDLRKLRLTQSEDHGSLRANSSRERLLSPDLEEYALQALLDSPQLLIAEEEKIIVEELKGNQTVVEEKTLVDTVYSLKDQVKDLRTEHKRMRKDLEDEKRARKRLEGLLRKSLRSLVETTWEEGANTS